MIRTLILALAVVAADAFVPSSLPLTTATSKRQTSLAATKLKMQIPMDRRNAIFLGGCSLGSLLLPTKAGAADQPVTVIGPSGGNLGSECIASLVRQGVKVRAVTRSRKELPIEDPQGLISYVIADVTKPDTLPPAIANSRAVIFAATAGVTKKTPVGTQSDMAGGQDAKFDQSSDAVDYIGAANVASACIKNKVPRFILVSAAACSNAPTEICVSKANGEQAVREQYAAANDPKITYTIARVGQLIQGPRRGAKEVELNQGDDKNGFISRADMADLLSEIVVNPDDARGVTFEAFYRDTANPTNIVASVTKCVEGGKSMKECFFGDAYAGNKKVDLAEMLKENEQSFGTVALPQGDAFKSGREVRGDTYKQLVMNLSKDKEEPFDIMNLGFKSG